MFNKINFSAKKLTSTALVPVEAALTTRGGACGSCTGEDDLGELLPPSSLSFVLLVDLDFAVPFTTSANLKRKQKKSIWYAKKFFFF